MLNFDDRNKKNLLKMFNEAREFCQQQNVVTIADLNKLATSEEIKELIIKQEEKHEALIESISQEIIKTNKRVVLICGPSSSGKTTFAKRICGKLDALGAKTLYMGTDDYYQEIENMPKDEFGQYDYECIEALDVDLFQENISDLIAGKEVDLPIFDFNSQHKIYGQNLTSIDDNTIIVIEGILTLNKKLTATIDQKTKYKIFICPISGLQLNDKERLDDSDIRLVRRICRDYRARNSKVERTIELWDKVRKGEEKNIFPFVDEADFVFNTYCHYEAVFLAKYIKPLLGTVEENNKFYSEVKRLAEIVNLYVDADKKEEESIPHISIIREFIGGSILVD